MAAEELLTSVVLELSCQHSAALLYMLSLDKVKVNPVTNNKEKHRQNKVFRVGEFFRQLNKKACWMLTVPVSPSNE